MKDYSDIYSITSHPEHNLVAVVIWGYFSVESHEQFKTDLANTVKIASANAGKKVKMLSDLRKAVTQPKEIANDNSWMAEFAPYVSKVGNVVESTLYKMQLARVPLGDRVRYFDTMEVAKKWLGVEDFA